MDTPWREAIIKVLEARGLAMHYTEIADAIIGQRLRENVGATPRSTVIATITSDRKQKGDASIFVRVNPGEYGLRGEIPVEPPRPQGQPEEEEPAESCEGEGIGVIQAFGMFWRRDLVHWSNNPRILGQQQQGAQDVDFSTQTGVYMLHDGRDVIYVGRATDRPLGRRLYEHTCDRLNGRWDRFSWFGLLRVTPQATLAPPSLNNLTADDLIAAMEALLIEGLEPPQNRKRGDEFRDVEYLQVEDPQLRKRERSALLDELKKKWEAD